MAEKIIVDSSPLIILLKSDLEYILPRLFGEVIVPEPVCQEILAGREDDVAREKLSFLSWLKRKSVTESSEIVESFNLGQGETAVLNLALEMPDSQVILDDFAARKCAKSLKIPFLGTGGILILAKREDLISSVSEAITRVRKEGLWISDEIIELLMQKAGE